MLLSVNDEHMRKLLDFESLMGYFEPWGFSFNIRKPMMKFK